MDILYFLIRFILIIIGVYTIFNILHEACVKLKDTFITFSFSNKYNFDEDCKLLRSIVGDMVSRYIQTYVLEGVRSESIDPTKTKIPYNLDDMEKDTNAIVVMVKGILQPKYIHRLERLYITRIDDYITLLVKDKYVAYINMLIDQKTIHAIERKKRLESSRDMVILDAIDDILALTGGINSLVNIIEDFSGLPESRLQKLSVESSSPGTKENAGIFLGVRDILKNASMTMDQLIDIINKDYMN